MSDRQIYISHAWGGESEEIVQEIYKRCRKARLNIIMDRKDLGYRESISSFMQNLGRADAIILVVSNKYLHSEYCMFELLQIYENKNIINRIFPVVLDEVSIAKSTERLELVKYWENETEDLEAKIRELKNLSYIEGITDDLNLYQKIRNNIANLTKILKDINTLNIRLHKDNDYNQLISAIEKYISTHENEAKSSDVSSEGKISEQPLSDLVQDDERKTNFTGGWWTRLFRMLPYFLIIVLLGIVFYFWYGEDRRSEFLSEDMSVGSMEMNEESKEAIGAVLSAQNPEPSANIQETDEKPTVVLPGQNKTRENFPSQNQDYQPDKQKLNSGKKPLASNDMVDIQNETSPKELDVSHVEDPNTIKSSPQDNPALFDQREPSAPAFRTEKVFVPASSISVLIPHDISSNKVETGDIVYLTMKEPFQVEGQIIAKANSRVRVMVFDAKASHQGGRGALGIRLEALETVDDQWLDLSYHDIIERRRDEIVFREGTVLKDVGIKPTTIMLKIYQ